jgi:hypothetical protein
VVIKKLRRAIAVEDVVDILNDQCIRELASISKLPADTDLQWFGISVRQAVRIYATDALPENVRLCPAPMQLCRERGRLVDNAASGPLSSTSDDL